METDPALQELLGGRSIWGAAIGLLIACNTDRLPRTPLLLIHSDDARNLLIALRRTVNVLRADAHRPEVTPPNIDPYFWFDRVFQVYAVVDYASQKDPELGRLAPNPTVPGLPPPEYRRDLMRGLERFIEVICERTGIAEPLEGADFPPRQE